MTQTTVIVKWWIYNKINERASQYGWYILAEGTLPYLPYGKWHFDTMILEGEVLAETEKAVKVSLDYKKHCSDEVFHGFTAWIPKSAIEERTDFEDDEITAADLRTYCSCGIE